MVKNRYTSRQKIELVLELLNTKTSMAELCKRHNIVSQTLNRWKDEFINVGKTAFEAKSSKAIYKSVQKENDSLKRLVGELTIARDILKKTLTGDKR